MAGEMLRRDDLIGREKFLRLCFAGVVCGLLGYVFGETLCPLVKRIWTPSWVLYSAGWTFGMLAAFYLIIDLLGYRRWALPMVIVGMNSIAVYCMSQLLKPWVRETFKRHLGQHFYDGTYFDFQLFKPVFAPVVESTVFLIVIWLAAIWMYRQKIFVRI
jgi:predicted acyltransferase